MLVTVGERLQELIMSAHDLTYSSIETLTNIKVLLTVLVFMNQNLSTPAPKCRALTVKPIVENEC